ncbi:MutS-related protein [Cardinium endosymbiont of Philonthus spinipes]|uniref:MutS-related protein n=1 Tax=Cardinium endosymbiont of Philonthus spinipes TaxID=3077941 RepID=UPI00313B220A
MRRNNNRTTIITFFFVLSLSFISSNWEFAYSKVNYESVTAKISRNYLRSFPIVSLASTLPSSKVKQKAILQTDKIKLAQSTQRKVVLRTIFSDVDANVAAESKGILNDNVWTDLMLFCGGSTNPAHHFLSRINRTTTVLGECALATLLVTPTSDITTLSNRQRTLQVLLEDPACLAALKQSLEAYRNVEQSLLSLWTYTDPLYTHAYRDYMAKRFLSTNPTTNKIANKLNMRIFFRNLLDIYGEFVALPLVGLFWCEASHWMTCISKGGWMEGNRRDTYAPFPFFVPIMSIASVVNAYNHTDGKPLLLPFLGVAATHAAAIWRGYCGIKSYQEYSAVFCNLASRMRDVQIFMKTIQQLSNIVAAHQELETHYGPSLSAIRELLAKRKEPTEIGVMVSNLLDMKLDNWSYIRSNSGKLLATYNLFIEHKDCLKPAMYALGQLDSFMGIATLVREAKEAFPAHCYTFTKFLDRSKQKTPCIQLEAMWNPMLNPATVVDNEVDLDATKTRNMILCGPNAGGKSSFISGVASSILLSQTFGIAAAKSAVITPFNKINTYIELRDDIACGASLFMVEVARMQRYIHMLEQSKPDEFIFTIADEPFARTNPVEASAAAYSILASIAQYNNALHIVSTHYPILMSLTNKFKDRGIRNFKVFIDEAANEKLHYTYKVVPGEADQAIALKILAQEGYDPALLKQAEDIVQSPQKWPLLNYLQEKNKKKR